MKLRKSCVLMLVFLSMFFASSVFATEWYTCDIHRAGPSGPAAYVQLSDSASSPAFTNRWFALKVDSQNAQLATLLSAIALESQVYVGFSSTDTMSTIVGIYLDN